MITKVIDDITTLVKTHTTLGVITAKKDQCQKASGLFNYVVSHCPDINPEHLSIVIVPEIPGTRRGWKAHLILEHNGYDKSIVHWAKEIGHAFGAGASYWT